MVNAKLITKTLGMSCNVKLFPRYATAEQLAKPECFPSAKIMDKVTGWSAAKGNFEILTYRNKKGELLRRVSNYSKGNKQTTITKDFEWQNIIKEQIEENGILTGNKITKYDKDIDKGLIRTEEIISEDGDRFIHSLLQQGKKPKRISYDTKWDGNAPVLEYENFGEARFTAPNQEYLPIKFANISSQNKQRLVSHLAKINEKKYGIVDIPPKPKIVTSNELNSEQEISNVFTMADTDPLNAQIRIPEEAFQDKGYLVETFGHEYKHASDIVDMLRYEETYKQFKNGCIDGDRVEDLINKNPNFLEFVQKCFNKGIIPQKGANAKKIKKIIKSTGEEYDTVYQHDRLYHERRAIFEGKQEMNKFFDVVENFWKFMLQNIA